MARVDCKSVAAFLTHLLSKSNSKMFKAKIVVVGPCESGKTVLSNILGDQVGSYSTV